METALQKLTQNIETLLEPHGYDLVYIETIVSRQKILRIFIDHVNTPNPGVRVEDCIVVNKLLDEPLEKSPEVEAIFKGPYELEVSSPGVDRPLRKPKDFERFSGAEIRVHLLRPLTAEESQNADYQTKNPKQKNYLGRLQGLQSDQSIQLEVDAGKGKVPIRIPMHLVSKCNIEPHFDLKKGADLS